MQNNEEKIYKKTQKAFQKIINNIFWMFILQGVSFILMGISVYFYPAIVVWLFVAGFIWLGITAIIAGVRTKKFGKGVDETMAAFS